MKKVGQNAANRRNRGTNSPSILLEVVNRVYESAGRTVGLSSAFPSLFASSAAAERPSGSNRCLNAGLFYRSFEKSRGQDSAEVRERQENRLSAFRPHVRVVECRLDRSSSIHNIPVRLLREGAFFGLTLSNV